MKKRLFSLLLAMAMILCALPVSSVSAENASAHYDLLATYINVNGTADDSGIMTLYSGFEDQENSLEYYFLLQNLGDVLSFQLMVYSLTDPGVNSLTTLNISRTGSTADVEFIMILLYNGEYADVVSDSRTISRESLTYGQKFTASAGLIIPADSASDLYTSTMATLGEFWDLILTANLGFGLQELGFTAFNAYESLGSTLTGTATGYGSGDTVVTLSTADGASASVIADPTTGEYGFTGIPDGTYTLTVSKDHHVTRQYTLEIEGDLTLDCTLNLIGDITGDGKVNMKDWSKLYNHVTETEFLTDYALECADTTGDGKVNMKDWSRMYDHINEVNPLW